MYVLFENLIRYYFQIGLQGLIKEASADGLQGDSSIEAVSTIPVTRITAHPIMLVLNIFFRFLADNVGYWLVHCHMSWHNHLGMAIILKVVVEF
jgi:hypothetical protein